ncbi:MAG: hypothetical protein U0441_16175 [Polyangiaceae bacterium]
MIVAPARAARLTAVDMVRGFFMLIILAGHAAANLDKSPASKQLEAILSPLFTSGTVGFTLVSGALLGSFAAVRPDMGPVLRRYREQGVRLLLVAHPLIALALYFPLHKPEDGPLRFFLLRHYMTDLLAIIFVVFAPLVPRMTPRVRLGVGVALMMADRALDASSVMRDGPWLLVREVLSGVDFHSQHRVLIENYPFLNILGMFLIGTFLGDIVGRAQKTGELRKESRRLVASSMLVPLLSLPLLGAWRGFKMGFLPDRGSLFRTALYPDREGSLFPIYLALVLATLGLALGRDASGRAPRWMEERIQVMGKTSLFTYVIQYYLVQTIPCLLGFEHNVSVAFWVVWTFGSIFALFGLSTLWNRYVKKV